MPLRTYHASKTLSQFHNDNTFIRMVMGPIGCVRGDTQVITLEEGALPIEQINRPMHVLSWNPDKGQFQFSLTGGAFPKGRDYLYRVQTQQGEFVASGHHHVLCEGNTYQRVDTLCQGQSVFLHSPIHHQKWSDTCQKSSPLDVQSYSQTVVDLTERCAELSRQYGQQLLEAQDTFPDFALTQDDVHKLYQLYGREDVQTVLSQQHNRQGQSNDHISIDDYQNQTLRQHCDEEHCVLQEPCEHTEALNQPALQSQAMIIDRQPSEELSLCYRLYLNSFSYGPIVSIEKLNVKEVYWDLQVLDTHNYVTIDGAVHHNSGKSVGMCWEIFMRACKQAPNREGIRKSRWVIVRNTLPQLETTTMNTWRDWFGERFFPNARISGKAPYKQLISAPLPDDTELELEILFMQLDTDDDVNKLLSLEATGIWFNEFREITKSIFEAATGRVGRYPNKEDGGCTWCGVICDTNPPDDTSWIYKMAEEDKPSNFKAFYQPSGLADDAENVENLPKDYYQNIAIGKAKEWCNVYVHGRYGYMQEGKTVYQDVWNDDFHFAKEPINIIPARTLIGGIDASGRSPAAVILQQTASGQMQCVWEFCGEDVGAVVFSQVLRKEINLVFPNMNIRWYGDPAGAFKTQNDERTYFDILRGEGIIVSPSPGFRTNDRIEAVTSILSRNIGGKPAFLLGQQCIMLRKGFNGGYRYKKIGSGGNARFTPDPEKNEYSHPHEALQYAIAATGEIQTMKNRTKTDYKVHTYATDW